MNDKLKNATIELAANIYFDGKVTSRTVFLESGERVTLGIMLPGDYTFSTGDKEIMRVVAGALCVLLPEESEWKTYTSGQSFEVPANVEFQVKVREVSDYLCSYIKK